MRYPPPPGRVPGAPWPPNYENAQASLNPPTYEGFARDVPQWYREPVYEPRIFFPNSEHIAKQARIRSVSISNQPANTEVSQFINIDVPAVNYAISAAAIDTAGAALPAGLDPLDTFLVRFAHNSGDRLTPISQLGSCVCGSGAFPFLIGGAGWIFDRGGSLEVGITPLRANLRIDVTCWFIEILGPLNYSKT
jgi:hypothetical protein